MIVKDWKKDLLTIPNFLSLFRLLLIPLYMTIYLNAQSMTDHLIAGGILTVSCLPDAFDGQIARRFNMISTVGKVLDPLADKATQFALILCLAIRYPVLWAVIVLFVIKEIFQLVAGIITLRKGKMLTGALMTGKICTTVLFVSLVVLVVFPYVEQTVINVIAIVDSLFLLVAFIDYARVYITHSSMIQNLPTDEEKA